mgnify:CR=1 FL=1
MHPIAPRWSRHAALLVLAGTGLPRPHALPDAPITARSGASNCRFQVESTLMQKNIIGNWGADLSDGDYACALAALGVLESRGTEQHPASSDPHEIAAALAAEFEDGERTPV